MTLRECCDWCAAKWNQAIEDGDKAAADAYQRLYSLWERRFKEAQSGAT